MSGHSKWATIKHKKAAVDKTRGKLFAKLARQLEVSARAGGGDPNSNATLRTQIAKAKQAQMTNDAIDRAIKRGTGEAGGGNYEAITYEGYAPGGVAVLVEVLTDNRNRTGAEVRNVFNKHGGAMAEPGAVSWQFSRQGVVHVAGGPAEDAVMEAALEAGADDVSPDDDGWRITSEPSIVEDVRAALEKAGLTVTSSDSPLVPSTIIELDHLDEARKVLRVIEALEDNEDVQEVYANFDLTDEVAAAVDA